MPKSFTEQDFKQGIKVTDPKTGLQGKIIQDSIMNAYQIEWMNGSFSESHRLMGSVIKQNKDCIFSVNSTNINPESVL